MPKTSHYDPFKNPYLSLLDKLSCMPYTKERFFEELSHCDELLSEDLEEDYELLKLMGAPLIEKDGLITLSTAHTPFMEQKFCFVDIESNGSNPKKDQVIEIGAVMYQHDSVIDRFESFVFCDYVPEKIVSLTHIDYDDLVNAPSICDVLEDFRRFLGNAVFVAHNVSFDFNFLNAMFARYSMGWLCNRRLCTIALARKTILASHYNLAHLNEVLDINTPILHRAYADAWTALHVFKRAIKNLRGEVHTTEDLLAFAQGNLQKTSDLMLD